MYSVEFYPYPFTIGGNTMLMSTGGHGKDFDTAVKKAKEKITEAYELLKEGKTSGLRS